MSKDTRGEIYKIIEKDWPLHETEIAKKLGLKVTEESQKKVVAMIDYHVKMLEKDELVMTKKIGRARVVWPQEIEKIRFIHEMMGVE
jgi:predicted transcriptional regulator